jgi:hypothetical protein
VKSKGSFPSDPSTPRMNHKVVAIDVSDAHRHVYHANFTADRMQVGYATDAVESMDCTARVRHVYFEILLCAGMTMLGSILWEYWRSCVGDLRCLGQYGLG